MILNATTEILQIYLTKSATTSQFNFYCSYNNLTSLALTPNKNQGVTNNSTPTILLPSPGVNEQNQLRYCTIVNTDSVANTLMIEYSGASGTFIIFSVGLYPNESAQYSPNNGWQIYNNEGKLSVLGINHTPNSLRIPVYTKAINITTALTLVSGTNYVVYLGKSDRSYRTIKVRYRVTSAPTTITWAEMAIYRGTPVLGAATTSITRCGFTNVSGVINSTGVKTTTINVSDISIDTDLYLVFGSVHTVGTYGLRAALADNLNAGFFSTVTGSLRPSTNASMTINTDSTTAMIWVHWQGSQW